MRLLIGVLCIVCALSACGGYSSSGNTVTFKSCSENGCSTTTVKEADPQSFESLQGDYAKDRHHVYFSGKPVQGADPQSLKVLSDIYAKDNARAYFRDKPIAGADSGSFVEISGGSYGRDKNDIYISGDAIGACDLPSFRWLKDDWQVDSKCAYERGTKLPNARPESFVVIDESYAKDAEHVYSSVTDKAIAGADVATFKSQGLCYSCGRDKNRCYDGAQPAPCGLH
jgi:hypothetical protein